MSHELESITLEDGAAPETATIRGTGITVAEIVRDFKAGKDLFVEHPELQPMDLVAAGAYYGRNVDAFREED